MFRRAIYLILVIGLMGISSLAQAPEAIAPNENQMYCGGVATTQPVRTNTYVISGPESDVKPTYSQGEHVFINIGIDKGVKAGDEFQVSRVTSELLRYPWFAWQDMLTKAMGTYYEDVGRLRVVRVQAKTSIAEVVFTCSYLQRGDIVEPFVARPAPAFKAKAELDKFSQSNGKAKAMIVFTKGFGQMAGAGNTVYVNLGAGQGVKVGDYFRVFKYQGQHDETTFNTPDTAFAMYGLGSTPKHYIWSDLPRDVLGEGIVLRVSPTAATVLITNSVREMYAGDFVELE